MLRTCLGLADQLFLADIDPFEQRLIGAREALAVGKKHHALQMHLGYVERGGEVNEGGQLTDRFLQPREPQRYARRRRIEAALERAERTHVLHDPIERVLAAHRLESDRLAGVERHAQLVEPARNEIASAPTVEQGAG